MHVYKQVDEGNAVAKKGDPRKLMCDKSYMSLFHHKTKLSCGLLMCCMCGACIQEKERKRKRKEHSKSSSKKHKHKHKKVGTVHSSFCLRQQFLSGDMYLFGVLFNFEFGPCDMYCHITSASM